MEYTKANVSTLSCAFMALVALFAPAWVVVVSGTILAVFTAGMGGLGQSALTLAPLALGGAGPVACVGFLVMAVICHNANARGGAMRTAVMVAGAGFIGFALIGASLANCVEYSFALGLVAYLAGMFPVAPGAWRASARGMVLVSVVYALPMTGLDNLVFARNFSTGLFLALALGFTAWAAKAISGPGALCGALIGALVYSATGVEGFTMLAIFVTGSVLATSLAHRINRDIPREKQRGAVNILANAGPPAGFALIGIFCDDPFIFNLGLCAGLGSALADTVSSELGQALCARPVDIITLAPAKPGDNGAISVQGTTLGVACAAFSAIMAVALQIATPAGGVVVFAGAVAGFMVDSWLGATFENKGEMTNGQVNAWATFSGAALAVYIGILL